MGHAELKDRMFPFDEQLDVFAGSRCMPLVGLATQDTSHRPWQGVAVRTNSNFSAHYQQGMNENIGIFS